MRFYEIKHLLKESADPADVNLAVDNLENELEQNPDKVQAILPKLERLVQFVVSSVKGTEQQPTAPVQRAQPATAPQQQPAPQQPAPRQQLQQPQQPITPRVAEDVATQPNLANPAALQKAIGLLQTIRNLIPKMDPNDQMEAEQQIEQLELEIGEIHQSGIQQGSQDLLDVQARWKEQELPALAKTLTYKVMGYLQTLKEISDEAIAKGHESPRNKKKAPDENTIYKQIYSPLEALFSKLADPKVGMDAQEYLRNIETVRNFMMRCEKGIFDIDKLVLKKVGNIADLISKNDRAIYNVIYRPLLSLTVSGGGSWGPGEIGLAVLGKPVQKQAGKGDLVVGKNKLPIELKSGADAKAGARLGGDGVVQARAAAGKFIEYLDAFVHGVLGEENSPLTKDKDGRPMWTFQTPKMSGSGKYRKQTGTTEKTLYATNMSSSTWFGQFNSQVLANVNPKKRKESSKTFLNTVLQMCLSRAGQGPYKEAVSQFNSLDNMLTTDGFIDYTKFLREVSKIWYHIYSVTDDVKHILVLNQSNGNFELIDNAADLTSNVGGARDKDNLKGIEITGGLDFGAGQIQLSPQVGIY